MDRKDIPMIHTWNGRPVTDLSREELIECVIMLGNFVEKLQKDALDEAAKALARLRDMHRP